MIALNNNKLSYYNELLMAHYSNKLCRYYLYGAGMLDIIEQNSSDLLLNIVSNPTKFNQSWGTNYMLMDSQSFMGGIGGEEYDNIINMFCNIWNAYEKNFV